MQTHILYSALLCTYLLYPSLPSPFPPHSRLLQVDESTLKQALVTRKSWAGGSEFVVAYKCEQATYTRDAMAKALYGALFDWIVEQVCECVGDVGGSEGKCEVCGCEGEGVGKESVTIPGHVPHSSTSVAIYEEEVTCTPEGLPVRGSPV